MLVDDYQPKPKVRWGHGKPNHKQLEALLESGVSRYGEFLRTVLSYREHLCSIPVHASVDTREPYYRNLFFPGLDCATLYTFVAETKPRLYVEIGSGNSTRFVRRAIRDHALRTELVSIDPSPRADIDALCDRPIRRGLEDCDPELFCDVAPGDIVFFDGSHRCLQNSDVTCFFMEVIPQLPPETVVHIHDIFLPEDYPSEWFSRYYSEQYLLAVLLLARNDPAQVLLPSYFVSRRPELARILDPLWGDRRLAGVERHGHSFWFRT